MDSTRLTRSGKGKFDNPTNTGNASNKLSGRSIPESLIAEAAVIGSMIIDPACIGQVVELVDSQAFYRVEHQMLYEALVHLYEKNKGQGVDAVLLRDELTRRKQLEEIGGVEYIGKIVDSVPTTANVEYYTNVVKDKLLLRDIISAASEILEDAYEPSGDTSEKIDRAEQKIFSVTNKKVTSAPSPIQDLVVQAYDQIEKRDGSLVTGVSTGYTELDDKTCGLQRGDMIIIAGRPSMGKTSFAMNIAENVAIKDKKAVAIFSLEMSKHQLAERLLCSHSRVDSQAVRRGVLDTEHYHELARSCDLLSEAQIYIDDTSGLTPLELRAKCRRLKSRFNIECVLIDYLQLMNVGTGRSESRQQEITTISRYLKSLARELNAPVIVLSQLNRAAENREGHRPRMSDLRESGSIEQDADVIMLLHREDYYHRNEPEYTETNKAELILAKQRNGPTGTIELAFLEKYTRFENLSPHIEEPF